MNPKLKKCSNGQHHGCAIFENQVKELFGDMVEKNKKELRGHPEFFNKSTEEIKNILLSKLREALPEEGFSNGLCAPMKPNVKLQLSKPWFVADLKPNDPRIKTLFEEGVIKPASKREVPFNDKIPGKNNKISA